MIVIRKHLSRRTLLRGLGASIALPMLDAMTPAFARAAQMNKPSLRLAFTYVPNGITMNQWTPTGTGAGFEFTRVMKPLEPFRKDTLVLSGLGHRNGAALGDGPGDHARAGRVPVLPKRRGHTLLLRERVRAARGSVRPPRRSHTRACDREGVGRNFAAIEVTSRVTVNG